MRDGGPGTDDKQEVNLLQEYVVYLVAPVDNLRGRSPGTDFYRNY